MQEPQEKMQNLGKCWVLQIGTLEEVDVEELQEILQEMLMELFNYVFIVTAYSIIYIFVLKVFRYF